MSNISEDSVENVIGEKEIPVIDLTSEQATVTTAVNEFKEGFSYEIKNSKSTVSELKTLFNSIVKAIETDEDVLITFKLEIQDNINISKPKSTIAEMKSLITTMLKLLEKDDAAVAISFKLRIESK